MLRPLLTAGGLVAGGVAAATAVSLTTGGSGTPTRALPDVVPTRQQQWARLRDNGPDNPYDVLIIGGGATGTGCAVDAATRGLRTALVEREDFASGTSSKSTKLVHGGVRYLEKAVLQQDLGQLKLVYEALHERKVLLQNAPHLTHALPILTPCYKWWEIPYYWAGMKAYDLVAGTTNLILSRYISPTEAVARVPTLARNLEGRSLKGGILYFDGQFNDARLNVTLACSAAAAGATVLNYAEVKKLIKNEQGQVIGARVVNKARDGGGDGSTALGGVKAEEVDVYARVVINATGVFTDNVRRLASPDAAETVKGSSGAHVTLPSYFSSTDTGVIIPKTKDGRVLFFLPFEGAVIAGTTDVGCEVTDRPRSSEEEVSFILGTMGEYLGIRLGRSDVLSAWAGIRPLPSNPKAQAKDTQSIVRDHVIFMDDDGLLNVTGGKWTTYRRMAEETIDAAVASGRLPLNTRACTTRTLPLLGAQSYRPTLFAELAQHHNPSGPAGSRAGGVVLETDVAQHLAKSYGDKAERVLQVVEETGLKQRLAPGQPVLEGEVVYCLRNEYCQTISDFLARRTRLAFLDLHAALQVVPRVADIMGQALKWSPQRKAAEIAEARQFLENAFVPVNVPALPSPPPPPTEAGGAGPNPNPKPAPPSRPPEPVVSSGSHAAPAS